MKICVYSILIAMLVVTACAVHPQLSSERNGLSVEKAIIAKNVDSEYEWIQKHYPGSRIVSQTAMTRDGTPYDKLDIITPEGKQMQLYFDISAFFGKW